MKGTGRTRLLVVLLLGLAGVVAVGWYLLPKGTVLGPGREVMEDIAEGEVRSYLIRLQANQFVRAVVDQRGVDVAVALHRPAGGGLLREVDGLTGGQGPEEVLAIADRPGNYELIVKAYGPGGTYRLTVGEVRPATPRDRLRIRAARLFDQAERLRNEGGSSLDDAIQPYQQALGLWTELAERRQVEETLYRLGRFHTDRRAALQAFERLLPLWRGSRREADLLNRMGGVHGALGDTQKEAACYERVLSLPAAQVTAGQRAAANKSLGVLARDQGDYQKALERLRQAREEWPDEDPVGKSRAYESLGHTYLLLGSEEQALDAYKKSLEHARAASSPDFVTDALASQALAYLEMRQFDRAREALLGVLESSAGRNANVLNVLGLVELEQRNLIAARFWHQRALTLAREMADGEQEAQALANLGYIQGMAGDSAEALRSFARAEELYGALGDANAVSRICHGRALVLLESGRLPEALTQVERSLRLVETMRAAPGSGELRASFLALRRDVYAAKIDILMALHDRDRTAGHDAEAFEVSEAAHGRTLLEALASGGQQLPSAVDPALLQQERGLLLRFQQAEREQLQHLAQGNPAAGLAGEEAGLQEVRQSLDEIREEIRRQDPRHADLMRPRCLSAAELQADVLDGDTLLVSYFLGRERSFVWVLGKDMLVSRELPAPKVIEKLAREAYAELSRPVRRGQVSTAPSAALLELSRAILEPLAEHLGSKRLLVIPDGALHYIPFAALPAPLDRRGTAPPLVRTHEIVVLPSASVLAVLRREAAEREPPAGRIAVLADPVFEADDPRLQSAGRGKPRRISPVAVEAPLDDLLRTTRSLGISHLERLEHTGVEAQAIRALVPDRRLEALGFDANRAIAMSPRLADYRTVHFATHGFFDSRVPRQSGIVLSLFDAAGNPQDGFLRLSEIYSLHLPVDLVVLSACQTALGEEVRGEGLVGLTRGFQHAGASRVLVSLWSVNDRATAELMAQFYQAYENDGLPAAAALRQAQLAMARHPRWGAPYHWAAFVLHGDWR
jgi:CHAT domain-containing protein/tetratricopeptide (TPR) repeat protein